MACLVLGLWHNITLFQRLADADGAPEVNTQTRVIKRS